jgi:dihydrofolate synthase/folylpolyglutamate synthase
MACVITSISLDHTQYLGGTIAEIAGEKAGIIKAGVPVIYDDNREEASAVIAAKASEVGAAAYPVGEKQLTFESETNVSEKKAGTSAEAETTLTRILGQVEFGAPYQRMNAALALKALEVLQIPGVTEDTCFRGLKKVRWPGRMERVSEHIWLDGAHNPGGIEAFIRAVKAQTGGNVHLLFAAVSDKDYKEMIHELCENLPLASVTVAHLDSTRATDQSRLAAFFREGGCAEVEAFPDVREALRAALGRRTGEERLYIVGSLYLIGEIKRVLQTMDLQEVQNI